MDDAPIAAFFTHLATRLRKENHLSDLTYALMQTVPEFKRDFIQFIQPDLPIDSAVQVEREKSLASGRPDFVFSAPAWDMIVENKLWDRNYHFDEYQRETINSPNRTHYALISNHLVRDVPEPWISKTWWQFIDSFKAKTYSNSQLFAGYLEYVRKICTISQLHPFSFASISLMSLVSLYHFNQHVEAALSNGRANPYCIESSNNAFGPGHSGRYFTLTPKTSSDGLYAFFGICYWEEPVFIEVDFESSNNRPEIYSRVRSALRPSDRFELVKDINDPNVVRLKMGQQRFDLLNAENSEDEQLKMLQIFLGHCCDALAAAMLGV